MRPILAVAACLPLALASACGGGSPTGPAAAAPSAERAAVDRREVTLTRPGEAASVTVTAGGQSTATPSLSLAGEQRWLDDVPVLDAAALAAGRLVAVGPGSAEVDAAAFGAAPARVTVHVRPGRPLILSATATGDSVVLRGYRLSDLATIRIGETTLTPAAADSATLRLALPPLAEATCTSGAAREAVTVDGADVAPGLDVARRRAGELAPAVGVPVRLSAEEAACLRLAPAAGARYALAFVDARKVREAATGFEGAAPNPLHYTVTVAEAGSAAPAALLLPPSASLSRAPDHVRRTVAPGTGAPAARTAPWGEGERFELRDGSLSAPLAVRVVRVYGGHLVLAVAEGEEPAGGTEAWLARADSAMRLLVRHGYPLFRAALSPTLPSTSAGSGQLLVVARRESSAYLGSTVTTASGGRASSFVFVNSAYGYTAAGMLKTLAHEVAHAWQERWAQDARGEAALGTGAAAWAVEGSADLLAAAVAGRALGIGLRENWEWAAHLGDAGRAPYATIAAGARGDLTAGYASGASFLLDLVGRMTARGVPEADALAEVSRGALEGWYGYARSGERTRGLVDRIGGRLGRWDPVDGLLTWTLSQAVDDLTPSAELQNPAFARIGTAGEASGAGWLAAARLTSGGRASRIDPAATASVSGNAATVSARYGSPGYLLIDDDAFGGAYTLTAAWNGAPLKDVEWMVVRYQ